jgi:hypothetical protein
MANRAAPDIDPVHAFPFRLTREDRVVTAGSCFAQHIARHLRARGFNYLVTEPAHPTLTPSVAETYQYGLYSARWGNIYTARQLRQLFRRAHNTFRPQDDIWEHEGTFIDPYRPAIQPNGFPTRAEYQADRAQHFAATRRAFAEMDCFIFTLGLTECWLNTADGAAYPLCPGTVGGTFDPTKHRFHDLSVDEVVADFRAFLADLRTINPHVRIILTVSPVPLAATAKDTHVLQATILSKSILRVAAGILARHDGVAYFPSYEIVTGPHADHAFEPDLRSVSEPAVAHVMRLFFRHATEAREDDPPPPPPPPPTEEKSLIQIICEEEKLGAG